MMNDLPLLIFYQFLDFECSNGSIVITILMIIIFLEILFGTLIFVLSLIQNSIDQKSHLVVILKIHFYLFLVVFLGV